MPIGWAGSKETVSQHSGIQSRKAGLKSTESLWALRTAWRVSRGQIDGTIEYNSKPEGKNKNKTKTNGWIS